MMYGNNYQPTYPMYNPYQNQQNNFVPPMQMGLSGRIEDAFLIGKDARYADLAYPNNYDNINMFHCEIEVEFGRVYLTDLASTTGTYLSDGNRLRNNVRYGLLDGECFYIDDRNEIFRIEIKGDDIKSEVSITESVEPEKEEPSITEPTETTQKVSPKKNFGGLLIFLLIFVVGVGIIVSLIKDDAGSTILDYVNSNKSTVYGAAGKTVCGIAAERVR